MTFKEKQKIAAQAANEYRDAVKQAGHTRTAWDHDELQTEVKSFQERLKRLGLEGGDVGELIDDIRMLSNECYQDAKVYTHFGKTLSEVYKLLAQDKQEAALARLSRIS